MNNCCVHPVYSMNKIIQQFTWKWLNFSYSLLTSYDYPSFANTTLVLYLHKIVSMWRKRSIIQLFVLQKNYSKIF